jgi:hypothetical protein
MNKTEKKTAFDTQKPEANKENETMKTNSKAKNMRPGFLGLCLLLGAFVFSNLTLPAFAAGPDSNPLTHWDTRYNYFLRFPAAAQHGIRDQHNPHGGHDVVENQRSMGPGTVNHSRSGQVYAWPVTIPTAESEVPTFRDEAIQENLFQTFGYPVSDTQFQIIERYNHNRFLEQLYDPEKAMWMSTSMAGVMANSAGNSAANMGVNQCVNAIDYVRQPLANFTAEAGNIWQRIRYELFIPMAVLLLLPGAVLAQVRSIVAQGSGVLGDVSPFEGILRSIIAIFLIPGSFLVINYGIDVSNSLTFTIADEYHRMFGSDMYEDAKCAIRRAMPINDPNSNRNAIEPPIEAPIVEHDVWSPYESWDIATRLYDPCIPVDESRLPDEDVNASMMINRLLFNTTLSSLGLTWNIYCAFQMVFLYYLWCMGPIASALWVWPIARLRNAFGSWVEGVVILCFWALFWNTSIFLLAAFKGIGDTGTVYTAALVFLSIQSVKYAFDFVGLVGSAAEGAGQMAKEAMGQIAPKSGGAGGGGGGGGGGAPGGGSRGGNGGGARGGGGAGGGSAPSTPSTSTNSTAGALSSGSPVGRSGLGANLSTMSPSPMPMPGGGPGGAGSGSGGPAGGPGGTTGAAGPEAGPDGGKGSGPPPGTGDGLGRGAGSDSQGGPGAGAAAGAAVAAIGGLSLGGKGADGAGGAPPITSADYSMSKSVTNIGGDVSGGDLSQLANRNQDNSLFNNTTGTPDGGGGPSLPPMTGADMLGTAAINQAGNALFGDVPAAGLDNKALTAAAMLAGPEAFMGGNSAMAGLPSAADRNPLAKDLALDQMHSFGSQQHVMANGIDASMAGNPQAELARASTQDLMKQSGIGDETLNRALAGDANATQAIQDKLGVSPMTLELARGGDPGAAALAMEASGRANGYVGALPPGEAQAQRDQLLHSAAVNNDPVAARELLARNGEHTIAAMSASQCVTQELQQAGVTQDQFRQALGGDANMQQLVSEKMGGASFAQVQSAYYGNSGDAAATMVARGNSEIQGLQAMGMSSQQIQQEAIRNGDASILAAQAAQSAPQGTLERAMQGDTGAQRELQQAIGSNPTMLEAAYQGSSHARSAIESASGGQNAMVMASASHNTQAVLSQMTGDPRAVEQALNGPPQQREAFVQQMSSELGVSPRVLNEAVSGGSLEASTVMARAGQVAEAGVAGGGNYQLSEMQTRLAEGLQSGNGLMMAAHASYSAATHGGQETQTLSYAAGGSPSHALAVSGAVQSSQELRSMGSVEANSVISASSSVTHGAGEAVQRSAPANPTTALHDASVTAQTTLRDAGIDPQAVVSGVRSGDTSELSRAATTFGVSPDVVQGALMRGDAGDAMTLVGAAGRQTLAQGPEAVQYASQTQSGQLALHVAQSVPQQVLSSAMAGNDVAQAQLARAVASDPQVLGSAAGNEVSLRAVGATLGDGAYAAVAASNAAQDMVRMHPDRNLVQSALYGQGGEQQNAMVHLARDMNVSPQVLANSLSGSSQDLSAMVSASSAGLQRSQEVAPGSPYFSELSRISGEQAPLAQAVQAAGYGQSYQASTLAGQGVPGAMEAVRATMEVNPQLSRLASEGNQTASAIMTAASHVGRYDHSSFGEVVRDVGLAVGAGGAIMGNLRPSDPVHGIQPHHHHVDRGAISGYEQFVSQSQPQPQQYTEYRGGGMEGRSGMAPAHPPDSLSHSGGSLYSPATGPTHHAEPRPGEPAVGPSPRMVDGAPGPGTAGHHADPGLSGPVPGVEPGIGPSGQYIAEQPRSDNTPAVGWFTEGRKGDTGSGSKLGNATSAATPIPSGGAQNRSLTPQAWGGAQNRKAQEEKLARQRIADLEAQARRAKAANDQAEYEKIKRDLEQYGHKLDDQA